MKFLILLFYILPVFAQEIKSFETDLCTMYREGTFKNPKKWAHCCVEHDYYYWIGGQEKNQKFADKRLRACVAETGENTHAAIIYYGVLTGHLSPVKLKHQWNWGAGKPGEFKKKTLSEINGFKNYLKNSSDNLAVTPLIIRYLDSLSY